MNLFRSLKSIIKKQSGIKARQRPFSGICTLCVIDLTGFVIPDGAASDTFARIMNESFKSIYQSIMESGGMILSNTGDAAVAVWEPSHVSPSHADLAMNCGRTIMRQRQKDQSEGGLCPDLCILIATGKMTGGMIGGQLQFVGDPWITIKRLESYKISKKSQMFYTSETLAHLTARETPKSVGRIKGTAGNEVSVFEFTP